MEPENNGCYIKAAWREFSQESGIEFSYSNFRKTVIFVSKMNGLRRDIINNYIYI